MSSPTIRLGRKVRLRHLEASDLPAVHRLAVQPAIRTSWRTRGDLWSFAQLEQHVAADPHVALVVTSVGDDELLGLVELHDVDLVDARAQLAILIDPAAWASGVAAEAAVLFAGFAFGSLPLEKLACTVQASNQRVVHALHRLLDHEGTLRRHLNVHGTWTDLEVFALWREQLPALEATVGLGVSAGPPGRPSASSGRQLRHELRAIVVAAGHDATHLDQLCFADLDSLAVIEVVLAAEEHLGREIAIEALALDQPITDLLAIAGHETAASR